MKHCRPPPHLGGGRCRLGGTMNQVRSFEGTIGMVVEHDGPLIPPGRPIEASIELGQGDRWRHVGTLRFDEGGRKMGFELSAELLEAVRRSAIQDMEWFGKEIAEGKRQPPDVRLARTVSRLADQVRDIRDLGWYHHNPVHLPHTGLEVLRTSDL